MEALILYGRHLGFVVTFNHMRRGTNISQKSRRILRKNSPRPVPHSTNTSYFVKQQFISQSQTCLTGSEKRFKVTFEQCLVPLHAAPPVILLEGFRSQT